VIIVVRHGRTEANASGLLLGRADPPLDDLGRAQADAIARVLTGVVRVVASPLRRAQETAAALGLPVETDERWIELDYGEWDERPIAEIPAAAWTTWRDDPSFRPPGGETLGELNRRVRAACADLAAEPLDGDVVVVTHVSPLKSAVAWALEVHEELSWHLFVAPGSITRIDRRDDRCVLLSFNEVAHLR